MKAVGQALTHTGVVHVQPDSHTAHYDGRTLDPRHHCIRGRDTTLCRRGSEEGCLVSETERVTGVGTGRCSVWSVGLTRV